MLDENLLQQRLNNFNPEPLVDYTETNEPLEEHIIIEDENNIDLAKVNFLNILNNETVKQSAEQIIRKYGVGTCGPRAFYGTTDKHLELEERLATFLNVEETIVYANGFVTISSSIAAYCKKNDVVFIDKHANFPIQQGLLAAKSKLVYFDHNDPASFQKEARKIAAEEIASKKKPRRKFLIIEGVSWKTGKLCPLNEFVAIAEEFKIRIFLEESYSFGIFGKTGRGLTEHFQIDPTRIDMIIATLEAAVGSIGGFCAGSQLIIEHQRLSGSGYIFSASLPTYNVEAALKFLDLVEETQLEKLGKLAVEFHEFLVDCKFVVESDKRSAFKIFNSESGKEDAFYEYCRNNGVHFIKNEDGFLLNLNVAWLDDHSKLEKIYEVMKQGSHLM